MIHPLSLQYVEVVRQEIKPNRFNLRLHYNNFPAYNEKYNIVPVKLEICSWSKVKAEELKDELYSLRNYVLNLDPEKSLTLVLYREFEQLKKKQEHDYVSKDTLIKFMQTLSGKVTKKSYRTSPSAYDSRYKFLKQGQKSKSDI